MSERFIKFESSPSSEQKLKHEENVLKSATKSKAGRWLVAAILATSAEAAMPSSAKAQDFFDWYRENYSTEVSVGADPFGTGGMGMVTIRERSDEDRRRVRREPEDTIVRLYEPPVFPEFPSGPRLMRRDRHHHPEDY